MLRVNIGDRVEIRGENDRGAWGVVRLIKCGEYRVALFGGACVKVYQRSQIRKARRDTPEESYLSPAMVKALKDARTDGVIRGASQVTEDALIRRGLVKDERLTFEGYTVIARFGRK